MTCVSLSRRVMVCATLCLVSPVAAAAQEASPIGSAIDSTSAVRPADEKARSEQESSASTLSLGATIKGLPRDVWNAVSFDTAKIAGVGLDAALAAHRSDGASLEEFQENARFRGFVRPGNTYGSFAVQAGGALGTYLIGRWSDHPRLAQVGLDVIRAQVVTQAWVQAAKLSINRERPTARRIRSPPDMSRAASRRPASFSESSGGRSACPCTAWARTWPPPGSVSRSLTRSASATARIPCRCHQESSGQESV